MHLDPNGHDRFVLRQRVKWVINHRAREVSLFKALFRRILGFVPYVENVADWLPIAYDFEFRRGEAVIATNRRRRWKWRDIYDIDASADTGRVLDRRLLLAATVGMDALPAR